ncbi:restriction endonuclease subunit S [Cellulophaga sp. 20_2_10]|nr:restriction endonuclease subunit S [Cellulophaga sp. 20_2_10]
MKFNSKEEYSFVEMKDLDPNNRTVLPSNIKKLKGGAKFQNGDTLFARITPCLQNGKICQVQGLKNNEGFGSTEFLVFRGKENISDNDFVYYLSREPFVRQFAEANMIGTSGRQRIAKEAFKNLELDLPPLPEQKAIASILSAIDDKIENNLATNKTLEDMAMALYKHWFVDFGPFKDGEFVDSELGLIPKGWGISILGDFVNHQKGFAFKSKWYQDNGKLVVRISDTTHNSINVESCNKISTELALKHIAYSLNTDDVIIATVGSWPPNYSSVVGKVVRVPKTAEGGLLNQNAVRLKMDIDNEQHQGLLYCILKNSRFLNYIVNSAQGSASQASIKLVDIFNYPIPFGGVEIIKEFSKLIQSNIAEQNALILENQTLTKLRDTLLPKLISGEVHLKAFRTQVENVIART